MLILTRKLGESIRIGDDITITVSDIKGNQIRLGIEAPGGVTIHREEVYRMIERQNMLAVEYDGLDASQLPQLWNQLMEKKGERK